jgi:prepilin peptidase CpaA
MLIITLLLTCLVVTMMITDITRYIIPNFFVLAVLCLYPVMVYVSPITPDWKFGLLVGMITFVIGYLLFVFKIMGGGDVKLLAVSSLYVSHVNCLDYLLGITVLGGILSLLLIILRPMLSYLFTKFCKPEFEAPRVLTVGAPLPYGVAIGFAFLVLIWSNEVTSMELPGIFKDSSYSSSHHLSSYKPQ